GRILLDQFERRAHAERLAEPHARPHACRLRGGGHGADERVRPRERSQRRRPGRKAWPLPKRRPQLESRDEDAGDHRNVCSTPENTFLSRLLQTGDMPPAENKALVRRFYEEAWAGGELGVIDELFDDDYVRH